MIAFKCVAAVVVVLNGQQVPCAGVITYFPKEREVHIGAVRVYRARLVYQPGRIVIDGTEILYRSGFE